MSRAPARATIVAGVPAHSPWVRRRSGLCVHDPLVFVEVPDGDGGSVRSVILRDIELDRARAAGVADAYYAPGDLAPEGGLSGDRETAFAQAASELLRRSGVLEVWADRSMPLLVAHTITGAGIAVRCDPEWGVLERRAKNAQERSHLRAAQRRTEQAIVRACEWVATARAGAGGVLLRDGEPLTSERVRAFINTILLASGMGVSDSIVASGPAGSDCHARGAGPIRTGEPVIIDVFPVDPSTGYHGDCTRCVVHGAIPPEVSSMHAAVCRAIDAGIGVVRSGIPGAAVHAAVIESIKGDSYHEGLPPDSADASYTAMVHGTGHGIGLEVHEPPILDAKGPELVVGDALTIEPGLYCKRIGGVRIEDLVLVTEDGCERCNNAPRGLSWS